MSFPLCLTLPLFWMRHYFATFVPMTSVTIHIKRSIKVKELRESKFFKNLPIKSKHILHPLSFGG